MLRTEMHFQALLAYEAVKGCFTDDQLQSKDEKVKMDLYAEGGGAIHNGVLSSLL